MKIAVYSCIVGGYDEPSEPSFIEKDCDYFMISDDIQSAKGVFKWIDVNSVVPNVEMSPKEKNRFCKFHPDILFPDYDYSIYLDGCIQAIGPIAHYIDDVGLCGIAVHKHRRSNCIYKEGIILLWLGVVEKEKIVRNMTKYANEGFPREFGMFECGMIVTDLNNPNTKKLYKKWYEEFLIGSGRDQQDLMYILWKNEMTKEDIGVIGNGNYSILSNPDICWHRKSHYK